MRRITGTIQQVFAMLDPPTTAITIATDHADLVVAVAAGDLAVALRGLRCGTPIDAEIEDTRESHTLDIYGHVLPEMHRNAVDSLDALLNEESRGEDTDAEAPSI